MAHGEPGKIASDPMIQVVAASISSIILGFAGLVAAVVGARRRTSADQAQVLAILAEALAQRDSENARLERLLERHDTEQTPPAPRRTRKRTT